MRPRGPPLFPFRGVSTVRGGDFRRGAQCCIRSLSLVHVVSFHIVMDAVAVAVAIVVRW